MSGFIDVLNRIHGDLLLLGVPLAVAFAGLGGILMVTSGGQMEQYGRGRNCIKFAGLGLAVIILAPIIIDVIKSVVGG